MHYHQLSAPFYLSSSSFCNFAVESQKNSLHPLIDTAKFLIVVAGPTAVGKTDMCIKIAKKFNTSIISSDSRQFFREMEIGTAKPTLEERQQVAHHFIDSLSIHDQYDVRRFENDTLNLLNSLFETHDCVIMTGGSGLYIDAVCKGFDEMPEIPSQIRESLNELFQNEGIEVLQKRLKQVDPEYFEMVDRHNPQRLIRALEVFEGTGKPFSSFRLKNTVERPFNLIKIGLERDRELLYERINLRMDQMIEQGLFEEAEKIFPYRHLNALQTVGYSEIFGYLDGKYDKEEAVRLLKRNSRRYAKRQLTWFKKDPDMVWFSPDEAESIIKHIGRQMD
ncbi:tRNA (adenosine(37)-N6)-dimethylallyltransferase MiaA [Litoribacter alkaliphilus]|uniref:tRNA dimethylallyltransferase n=1 Tax=Litoribacter ruber TaxID=702568 RepID=A0AAP2CJF4_9BACT|nr:tRNA (adenosine(37)-N6)-dimethylallyltransferase MiaA [Litoribacter alkaliphilus]